MNFPGYLPIKGKYPGKFIIVSAGAGGREEGTRQMNEEPENGYECLICGESVRRQPALQCTHCTCKPWHLACGSGLQTCPQCAQSDLKPFTAPLTLGAPSGPCVDLTRAAPAQTGGARKRGKQPVVVVDSDEESAEGFQVQRGDAEVILLLDDEEDSAEQQPQRPVTRATSSSRPLTRGRS